MKIVTYNVNGLRQRVSQHGSLLKFLNSLDADIICLQETKLQRQDLSVDVTMANGYEAFISCTRSSGKGRLGYSGVATFCRVNSAFSTDDVALPVAVEEGFTGLLESSKTQETLIEDFLSEKNLEVEGFEHITKEDLIKVDSEGRCIITDHGHFVLFNLYGPRACDEDKERTWFKFLFFKLLQRRWESLLSHGKRVVVVGDFNIAPTAMDRCDAEPDFEKNLFRRWFRSILRECGGAFFDVFRSKHPYRKEAYTCFSPRVGAEEFNYGSRIDHILIAGQCLHEYHGSEMHLFDCHVKECDIMIQFLRGNSDRRQKWNGGRSIKLEGSDHIPVYVVLNEIPNLPLHNIPPLAVRYFPEVRGWQQSIVSFLKKRPVTDAHEYATLSDILSGENATAENGGECSVSSHGSSVSMKYSITSDSTNFDPDQIAPSSQIFVHERTKDIFIDDNKPVLSSLDIEKNRVLHDKITSVKKARCTAYSQLTLRSFFKKPKTCTVSNVERQDCDESLNLYNSGNKINELSGLDIAAAGKSLSDTDNDVCEVNLSDKCPLSQDKSDISENDNLALFKWQKIQQKMKMSIPLCRGHGEPCVARSVKKGPNIGRGFYVCARAQGPATNPESNCGHFQWSTKKSQHKK